MFALGEVDAQSAEPLMPVGTRFTLGESLSSAEKYQIDRRMSTSIRKDGKDELFSLMFDLVARCARSEVTEELELAVWLGIRGEGWVVRAREERLGDIATRVMSTC